MITLFTAPMATSFSDLFLGDNIWALWFTLAAILIASEFLTGDFTALLLGGAALVAAGLAFVGVPLWGCVIAAVLVGGLLLQFARKPLRDRLAGAPDREVKTTFQQITGSTVESVDLDKVRVTSGASTGAVWSAQLPGGAPLELGRAYRVTEVATTFLVVEPLPSTTATEGEL